jgi:hypothetical protein
MPGLRTLLLSEPGRRGSPPDRPRSSPDDLQRVRRRNFPLPMHALPPWALPSPPRQILRDLMFANENRSTHLSTGDGIEGASHDAGRDTARAARYTAHRAFDDR